MTHRHTRAHTYVLPHTDTGAHIGTHTLHQPAVSQSQLASRAASGGPAGDRLIDRASARVGVSSRKEESLTRRPPSGVRQAAGARAGWGAGSKLCLWGLGSRGQPPRRVPSVPNCWARNCWRAGAGAARGKPRESRPESIAKALTVPGPGTGPGSRRKVASRPPELVQAEAAAGSDGTWRPGASSGPQAGLGMVQTDPHAAPRRGHRARRPAGRPRPWGAGVSSRSFGVSAGSDTCCGAPSRAASAGKGDARPRGAGKAPPAPGKTPTSRSRNVGMAPHEGTPRPGSPA